MSTRIYRMLHGKWNFEHVRRENCIQTFVFTRILFLLHGMKCTSKKDIGILKSQLLHELRRQIDDRLYEATLRHGGHWIDQSVCSTMSFWHRDSQNCAFARFRSPRLFMEAMQFTDNRAYALVEKTHTHTYILAHSEPRVLRPGTTRR